MASKYLVWQCEAGCGGIGDRFVGLVTCSVIAEILGWQFIIDWRSPDVSVALTINPDHNYATCKEKIAKLPSCHEHWVNGHHRGLCPMFKDEKLEERWKEYDVVYIKNNQPFHLLLWSNPHYTNHLPCRDEMTHQHYKKIFVQYFTITPRCYDLIQPLLEVIDNTPNTIALHMRFGDWNYNLNRSKEDKEQAIITHATKYAKNLLKNRLINAILFSDKKTKVVLLGDAKGSLLVSSFQQVFAEQDNVEFFATGEETTHLGLYHSPHSEEEICRTFSDLIIMTHCQRIVFWDNSNFPRVGILALSSKADVWIYNYRDGSYERNFDRGDLFVKERLFLE